MTSQTDTTQDADFTDYAAISKAMGEGNKEELDRLMAVQSSDPAPKEDAVVEDDLKGQDLPEQEEGESVEKEAKDNVLDQPDKSSEEGNKEAASAASSVNDADELEKIRQELHRYKSDAGRVPFMQRRLQEVERELRAAKARSFTGGSDSKPVPTDVKGVTLDTETQSKIDALRETDPTLADMFEHVAKNAIAAANSRADHVVNTISQQEQEAENARFFMEQKAELTRMIPQHDQVFAMPEWRAWKDTLSPAQRAVAESGYASDVSQAIYAFAAEMQRSSQPLPSDTPAPNNPAGKSDVSEARDRKAAATTNVRSPAAKASGDFDEDAYFREIYQRVGKEQNILPS